MRTYKPVPRVKKPCGCGCGQPAEGYKSRVYVNHAHQMRAYRQRRLKTSRS